MIGPIFYYWIRNLLRMDMISNKQIIEAATVNNPERFRYEVKSKPVYINSGLALWANGRFAYDHYSEWIYLHNSVGKTIAFFKIKAWK